MDLTNEVDGLMDLTNKVRGTGIINLNWKIFSFFIFCRCEILTLG